MRSELQTSGAGWLVGGGAMGDAVRAFDWSKTPLGPMPTWPESLRTAVSICLASRFPMFVWWGPELINIYNDGYVPMLGKRHPSALGRPARDSWEDIWDVVGPQADAVMLRGEATWNEQVRLVMERKGYWEDTYFTWSYSPIRDGSGRVRGLYCAVTEETERVRAEATVRQSEARFRALVNATSDVVYRMSADWTEMLQLDGRGFLPDTGASSTSWLEDYIPPDDRPAVLSAIREAIRTKGVFQLEHRVRRADGTVAWTSSRAVPLLGPDGDVVEWIGSASDVTTRRRAEDALRESEERFRLMANTIPQLAWMAGPDGWIFWYNERWYEYTGTTPRQMEGWGWEGVHDPAVLPEVMRRWKQSVETGHAFDMTFPLRGADGAFRPFLTRVSPLTGPDGRVVLWFGTNTDISERSKLEERFRVTADSAPVLIWIADTGKACTWFNRPWLEFTGRTMEQECGEGWTQVVHPDDLALCLHAFRSSFDARRPFKAEYRLRRHDGEWRWVVAHGAPLYEGPGGAFSGFIGSCVDIHDAKQAEAARLELLESERAARLEAERASRLKDDFLATLSHELRTPLNAILGWSQLLDRPSPSPDELAEGLSAIARNARAQTQLIEDLLDMSRVMSGKLRLDVQEVNLSVVIEAALESVAPAAAAKGIRVERVLDTEAGPVIGDPTRLQQVVWNLLTNAVKFTPRDGKVQVVLERVNSHVEISVSDTGQGIAADFLPHVFERFRQADPSTTRRHGGLGIGLSLVKQITEMHGGTVRVRSDGDGKGATFVVTLPLSIARMAKASPAAAARAAAAAADPVLFEPVDLRGVKVLVVDDDPDARAIARRILESCHARVISAGSAREGLELVKEQRPDVIVSDIGMPQDDGYEFIRWVRKLGATHGGNVPAAALTAFARSEDRRRTLMAGYQSHVVKPVEPDELVTVVASLAGRAGVPDVEERPGAAVGNNGNTANDGDRPSAPGGT